MTELREFARRSEDLEHPHRRGRPAARSRCLGEGCREEIHNSERLLARK